MSVYENVDYDGLLAKMDQKSFVIDVRERHELAATGSLPNSINVPLGELENDLNLSAEVFEKKYQVPKPDKDSSEIVFSCARGNRSRRAAEIAFKLNYKKSNALFLPSGQMYVYQCSNISKLLIKD